MNRQSVLVLVTIGTFLCEAKHNKFGIGCYYPPGMDGQLNAAADLVGVCLRIR